MCHRGTDTMPVTTTVGVYSLRNSNRHCCYSQANASLALYKTTLVSPTNGSTTSPQPATLYGTNSIAAISLYTNGGYHIVPCTLRTRTYKHGGHFPTHGFWRSYVAAVFPSQSSTNRFHLHGLEPQVANVAKIITSVDKEIREQKESIKKT